jgi:hypothetical protein
LAKWDFKVVICGRKLFESFCLRLRSLYIIILCFFLSYFKKNVFQSGQRDTVAHDTNRFKISVEILEKRAKLVREELRYLKSDFTRYFCCFSDFFSQVFFQVVFNLLALTIDTTALDHSESIPGTEAALQE